LPGGVEMDSSKKQRRAGRWGASRWLSVAVVLLLCALAQMFFFPSLKVALFRSGKSEKEVLLPLADLRPNAVKRPSDVALCFVFSTLLDTGGVEAWYWALFDNVFTSPPFVVHAVQLNDLWSVATATRFASEGVVFNPGLNYLVDTCDVIVSTGSQPLPAPRLQRKASTVLVIHGSKGCQWTWRYAQHAALYDYIVGVSNGAVQVLDSLPSEVARAHMIPSGVVLSKLVPRSSREALLRSWGVRLKPDTRILLYLGRISSEKNPQYFVDVVDALPNNWVGLMVGPAYFSVSFPSRSSSRIVMTGRIDGAVDPLTVADAVLLASPSEGGPIVLLEAWAMRVPFFMRRTGIAAAHPEAVFLLGEDEPAADAAIRVMAVVANLQSAEVRAKLDAGYAIVTSTYAIDRVTAQWTTLLREAVEASRTCGEYTVPLSGLFALSEAVVVTVDGHHRILSVAADAPQGSLLSAELPIATLLAQCSHAWVPGGAILLLEYSVETPYPGKRGSCSVALTSSGGNLAGAKTVLESVALRSSVALSVPLEDGLKLVIYLEPGARVRLTDVRIEKVGGGAIQREGGGAG
jgi:glycosyltransferase involved in cell wall biosynthesis